MVASKRKKSVTNVRTIHQIVIPSPVPPLELDLCSPSDSTAFSPSFDVAAPPEYTCKSVKETRLFSTPRLRERFDDDDVLSPPFEGPLRPFFSVDRTLDPLRRTLGAGEPMSEHETLQKKPLDR